MPRHSSARFGAAIGLILLLWAAVFYLAARYHGSDPPAGTVEAPRVAAPEQWSLIIGGGRASRDGLLVERLDPAGEAFLVWRPEPFDAARRPLLRLRIDHFPLNYVPMLAWRRAGVAEASFMRLQVPRGGSDAYLTSRHPEWSGSIEEIALYLHPQPTSPPLQLERAIVLRDLRLESDGWAARLAALRTGWLAPDPWAMLSVSTLGVYPDLDEGLRLTPLVFVLCVLGILVSGGIFARTNTRRWGHVIVGWLVAAAVVINAHWLSSLALQRTASKQLYAGLTAEQKAARVFDHDLVDHAAAATKLLPAPPQARVFIAADARFFRLRAAWHLRPHNLLTFLPGEDSRNSNRIRPGDYLFVHRRGDLMEQARRGVLSLKRGRWAVELLFDGGSAGLLRFTERRP